MNVLTRYIQRQLFIGENSMRRRAADSAGHPYSTRTMTVLLQKYARDFLEHGPESKRWVVIPGLRGVGKTTITAQTYLWILNQVGLRVNLLYISLDEVVEKLGSNLSDVLDEYQTLLGYDFETTKKPTFIFIDEVQSDPNWARTIKFLFDRTSNVFFLCTGSSAVHLQMDADVDGRRAVTEKLYPLSFPEYQVLANDVLPPKGMKNALIQKLYYSKSATEVYKSLKTYQTIVNQQWARYDRNSITTYLTKGTMPFTLKERDERMVYGALKASVDKVVTLDLQSLSHFNSDSIAAIKRLLFILADCNDYITLDNMSKWIGASKPQVINMLDALTKAELLIKVPAYGNNMTQTRNPARYHFMSPAIRAAYHDIVGNPETEASRRGLLLEDAVVLQFYREFMSRQRGALTYYHDKEGGQCDFILRVGNDHQISIELGLGHKGTKQVETTMAKVECAYGIVFADVPLTLHEEKNIITVPLDFLFLM
ncbi:MAG: ATP-binding protein [Patescibacteria group bacterium]|jgi:hypothetical protein|nr:ATP-binding protein [Patescibacteria group bacterium]